MYANFDRFSIKMTLGQANSCSHSGDCYADVMGLLLKPAISKQIDAIKQDDIRAELKGYGAWDETELQDNESNRERILWIAAGSIHDEHPNTPPIRFTRKFCCI